jgi:membrane protein implicated in regulation of membrane protease activity
MGLWMIVFSGSVPIGALWTGRAALAWGVDVVMAASAVACVAMCLAAFLSGILKPREPGEPPKPGEPDFVEIA